MCHSTPTLCLTFECVYPQCQSENDQVWYHLEYNVEVLIVAIV